MKIQIHMTFNLGDFYYCDFWRVSNYNVCIGHNKPSKKTETKLFCEMII